MFCYQCNQSVTSLRKWSGACSERAWSGDDNQHREKGSERATSEWRKGWKDFGFLCAPLCSFRWQFSFVPRHRPFIAEKNSAEWLKCGVIHNILPRNGFSFILPFSPTPSSRVSRSPFLSILLSGLCPDDKNTEIKESDDFIVVIHSRA